MFPSPGRASHGLTASTAMRYRVAAKRIQTIALKSRCIEPILKTTIWRQTRFWLNSSRISGMRRFTAFAEDDLQFAAPVFGERDEFPLDFRREIAKYRLIGGMNSQRGRGERKARWQRGNFGAGKIALPLEGRQGPGVACDDLPVLIQCADANPIVEGLHGQMQILIGLQFDNGKSAFAIESQQVEHAAVSGGQSRHLAQKQIVAQIGQQLVHVAAQPGLQPSLRLQAEERVGMGSVGMTAEEEPGKKFPAEWLILRWGGGFVW